MFQNKIRNYTYSPAEKQKKARGLNERISRGFVPLSKKAELFSFSLLLLLRVGRNFDCKKKKTPNRSTFFFSLAADVRLQLRTANQGSSLSVRERHRHTGGAAGGVKAREKHKTLVEKRWNASSCFTSAHPLKKTLLLMLLLLY